VSDNITLPRAVGKTIRKALTRRERYLFPTEQAALAAIDAALAEPEKERAETVTSARCVAGSEKPASSRDESYRTTEPPAKPEPVAWLRHDGIRYKCFIGPKDGSEVPLYTAPPAAAKPEPATDAEIVKAGGECAVVDNEYLLDFRDGFRAAERFHGIKKEDK